jgi:hypothetical protein
LKVGVRLFGAQFRHRHPSLLLRPFGLLSRATATFLQHQIMAICVHRQRAHVHRADFHAAPVRRGGRRRLVAAETFGDHLVAAAAFQQELPPFPQHFFCSSVQQGMEAKRLQYSSELLASEAKSQVKIKSSLLILQYPHMNFCHPSTKSQQLT